MNAILVANVGNMWLLAGWTMVHFLWLGTLVALAALVSRWLLRRAAANLRYGVALACLAILAAMPVAIAGWLHAYSSSSLVQTTDRPLTSNAVSEVIELKNLDQSTLATPPAIAKSDMPMGLQPVQQAALPSDTRVAVPVPALGAPSTTDPLSLAVSAINRSVQYLPWLWLIGTPLTFAFTATGLIGTRRLRRAGRPITDGPIAETLAQLTSSLRLTRRVIVAVCDRIAAPVLIGILRPIILLPPAALTGYSPEEIEMVLLHELAHVRRWDNLVNLIQRVVESLLFFHPAVWLISDWVRREREACCDALVVARTEHPHAYAELLVALAAQMPRSVLFHPAASSAMAAGPLRSRIRQILKLDDDPMLVSGKSLAVVLGSLLVAATLAAVYLPTTAAAASEDAKLEAQTKNNLKNQMLNLLNYEAAHKSFPANAIYSSDGKPLLSWRVELLPFIDRKLYDEFHRDEPWDSEHNRKLIARMPDVFKNPKLDQPGKTNYLAVVGDECFMTGTPKKLSLKQITDGTSRTISLVEADPGQAVEWTRPLDWKFDRDRPTQGLGQVWNDHWDHARVDGSLHQVDNSQSPDAVGILFTRNGGEQHSLAESANRQQAGFAGEVAPGPEGGAAATAEDQLAERAVDAGSENSNAATAEERARFEHFEKSLKSIEIVIAMFNDSAGYMSQLETVHKVLVREHHSLYTWGLKVDPKSSDGKRYQLTDAPACIVFRNGKEVGRLAPIPGGEQLKEFVNLAVSARKVTVKVNGVVVAEGLEKYKTLPHTPESEKDSSDSWPMGVAFPSPKEGEISARVWRELHLKVIPASKTEQATPNATAIKVVGGVASPPGVDSSIFLLGLNDIETKDFDELDAALKNVKGKELIVAKCVTNTARGPLWIDTALGDKPSVELSTGPKVPRTPFSDAKPSSKFPSLENQKLADLIWKRLALELEPIGAEDLRRVKALGYDGGVKVIVGVSGIAGAQIQGEDILVGLHAWPITNLKDVATVLSRDDLAELIPLKFYVIRQEVASANPNGPPNIRDAVRTGRVSADLTPPIKPATRWSESTPNLAPALAPNAASDWLPAPGSPYSLNPAHPSPVPITTLGPGTNPSQSPYNSPPLLAMPGETTQPASPRSPEEFSRMQSERVQQLISIAQAAPQNESPRSQERTVPTSTSAEELEILRDRIKIAEMQFKYLDEQFKKGTKEGGKDRYEMAAYELALAQANLATAEGKRDEALTKLIDARTHAEAGFKAIMSAYDAGRVSYDLLRNEANRLAEIKLRVARLKGEKSPASSTKSSDVSSGSSAVKPEQDQSSTSKRNVSPFAPPGTTVVSDSKRDSGNRYNPYSVQPLPDAVPSSSPTLGVTFPATPSMTPEQSAPVPAPKPERSLLHSQLQWELEQMEKLVEVGAMSAADRDDWIKKRKAAAEQMMEAASVSGIAAAKSKENALAKPKDAKGDDVDVVKRQLDEANRQIDEAHREFNSAAQQVGDLNRFIDSHNRESQKSPDAQIARPIKVGNINGWSVIVDDSADSKDPNHLQMSPLKQDKKTTVPDTVVVPNVEQVKVSAASSFTDSAQLQAAAEKVGFSPNATRDAANAVNAALAAKRAASEKMKTAKNDDDKGAARREFEKADKEFRENYRRLLKADEAQHAMIAELDRKRDQTSKAASPPAAKNLISPSITDLLDSTHPANTEPAGALPSAAIPVPRVETGTSEKQSSLATAFPNTVTVANAEEVKVADHYVTPSIPANSGPAPVNPNQVIPGDGRSSAMSVSAGDIFVAYDIPADVRDKVVRYLGTFQSEVHSMADDRGHFIIQANQPWHDNFAALLKATPKWSDPAAAKERAAAPVVMKKVGNEDNLEWRSVGLSLKRNTETNHYTPASKTGAAVAEVAPGSPAAWADIRPGDVLTDVGSFHAGNMPEVQSLLKALGEGLQSKTRVSVKFVRNSSQGFAFGSAGFTLGPEDLGAKPAESETSKSTATAQPSTAPIKKSNFRYEGKTFNEWQNAWQTELSTEKRADAVKALAAFGANGYGRDAAKAIVEIAGQYDWTSIGGNEAADTLKKACLGAFGYPGVSTVARPIPENDVLLALLAAIDSKNTNDRLFATWVLPTFAPQNKMAAEALRKLSSDTDAQVRSYSFKSMNVDAHSLRDNGIPPRIRQDLMSNDSKTTRAAIKTLVKDAAWFNSRGVSIEKSPALYYVPELFPLLFAPDESVRREARQSLRFVTRGTAKQVIEQLLSLLDDDARRADHVEAIRAIAAMGPEASPALDKLKQKLSTSDAKVRIPVAAAIKMIVGKDQYQKPVADVLGEELGITVVKTGDGAWGALPRDDSANADAFNKFTEDVIKEQELLFPPDDTKSPK